MHHAIRGGRVVDAVGREHAERLNRLVRLAGVAICGRLEEENLLAVLRNVAQALESRGSVVVVLRKKLGLRHREAGVRGDFLGRVPRKETLQCLDGLRVLLGVEVGCAEREEHVVGLYRRRRELDGFFEKRRGSGEVSLVERGARFVVRLRVDLLGREFGVRNITRVLGGAIGLGKDLRCRDHDAGRQKAKTQR